MTHQNLKLGAVISLLWMLAAVGYAQKESVAKQPIHGLVTMGNIGALMRKGGHADNVLREANAHPEVYRGVVLLFGWDELEPTEGKLDESRIQAALDEVRAYNRKYPSTPIQAKLRIFSGWHTPDWVIAKSGGPISLSNRQRDITIGRFWSTPYRKAWRQFQGMLAKRYDNDPLIGEVAVSSCATISAEPFVQPLSPENLTVLHAAGFNDRRFKACLLGAIRDYAGWKTTPIDYTMNPFHDTDGGSSRSDEKFVNKVMVAFRKRYGSRAVLANHGLQSPLFQRQIALYSALKKMGPPIEFQTISPHVDWPVSITLGLQYGATEIEIWNTKKVGGPAPVTYKELQQWSREMPVIASQ